MPAMTKVATIDDLIRFYNGFVQGHLFIFDPSRPEESQINSSRLKGYLKLADGLFENGELRENIFSEQIVGSTPTVNRNPRMITPILLCQILNSGPVIQNMLSTLATEYELIGRTYALGTEKETRDYILTGKKYLSNATNPKWDKSMQEHEIHSFLELKMFNVPLEYLLSSDKNGNIYFGLNGQERAVPRLLFYLQKFHDYYSKGNGKSLIQHYGQNGTGELVLGKEGFYEIVTQDIAIAMDDAPMNITPVDAFLRIIDQNYHIILRERGNAIFKKRDYRQLATDAYYYFMQSGADIDIDTLKEYLETYNSIGNMIADGLQRYDENSHVLGIPSQQLRHKGVNYPSVNTTVYNTINLLEDLIREKNPQTHYEEPAFVPEQQFPPAEDGFFHHPREEQYQNMPTWQVIVFGIPLGILTLGACIGGYYFLFGK
jgi:hypothetical protein